MRAKYMFFCPNLYGFGLKGPSHVKSYASKVHLIFHFHPDIPKTGKNVKYAWLKIGSISFFILYDAYVRWINWGWNSLAHDRLQDVKIQQVVTTLN